MNRLLALFAPDSWLSRHWLLIVLLCLLVIAGFTRLACHEGERYEQAVHADPPIPKKVARSMIAKSRADSTKAVVYKAIAHQALHVKDSVLLIARVTTHQADSLHAEVLALPAAARGPIAAVERALTVYRSPDTTSTGH